MHRQALRVFSNVTPIQSAAMTMVDLGDTSHCLTVALAPQQLGGDGSRSVAADISKLGPIFDLRNMPKTHDQRGSLKQGLKAGAPQREDEPSSKAVPKPSSKLPHNRLMAETLSPDGEGVSVQISVAASTSVATPSVTPSTMAYSGLEPESPLRGDEGLKLPRRSFPIKRTRLATQWYIILGSGAIEKPPVLHTTISLEVGDLFINKYSSKSYEKDVLQIWLLLPTAEGEGFWWSQVSGETEHPNLPELVLSFQPMDFSAPTWVRRQTDQRRRRERPRVLVPGEGTFTEYK